MLVLSRKKNESVVIDENIVVTVVEIRGDKVRLGFEGPKEIPIHSKEVRDAIRGFRETPDWAEPAPPAATIPPENSRHLETIEQQQRTIQRQSELIHNLETLIRDYQLAAARDQS